MINNAAHFIFDSEHIDSIESRLYGFCTTKNGLFSEVIPSEDITDATGAWVLVKRTPEQIEITQDSMGCFGLFLFRHRKYWALSNSFNHLLDYLKSAHKLSFNKDYADALLSQQLRVSVYGETIIREIQWLDRRAKICIDFASTKLSITYRNLNEKTISVDTMEGIRLLDTWHDKWTSYIRKAGQSWPGKIEIDVSGGFDTRMVLAPILSSGLKARLVRYNSDTIHEEDFRISSMIAEEFGFPLNQKYDYKSFKLYRRISPIGSYSVRALETICFEKETKKTPDQWKQIVPTIVFRGHGGELTRNFWGEFDCQKLIENKIKGKDYNTGLFKRKIQGARRGAEAIMRRSFQGLDNMLKETDSSYTGAINGQQYYKETCNRSHHGMPVARGCLSQVYTHTPLFDPLLLKLRTPSDGKHILLICAIILTRYHEKLISFPFEGGRTIPEKTIQYAQELNRRFPRETINPTATDNATEDAIWQPFRIIANNEAEKTDHENSELRPGSETIPMNEKLLRAFDSASVQKVIKKLYGKSINFWLNPNLDKQHPNAAKYAAVAISKVWYDVKKGKKAHKDFSSFIEACLSETRR